MKQDLESRELEIGDDAVRAIEGIVG
jgi:hypothetical protein